MWARIIVGSWIEDSNGLASWIRCHPEVWHHSATDDGFDPADESVIEAIINGSADAKVEARRARRLRRFAVGAASSVIVVAASAVGVAAIINSRQSERPESGARCMATVALEADGLVLAPGEDPVDGCRKVWAGAWRNSNGVVPDLTPCINVDGGVDVFPADDQVCAALGLDNAAASFDEHNLAVIKLQNQVVEEINLGECRPVAEVIAMTETIIAEVGLANWAVVVGDGADGGLCGKVAVDSATRTAIVNQP